MSRLNGLAGWLVAAASVCALFTASALSGPTTPSQIDGGVYNATPPTYSDGQTVVQQYDSSGNLKVVTSGTPSGTQHVDGTGTAGTAAGGVLTVQGQAAMTPLLVTPSLPSGASTAALQSSTQGTVAPGTAATATTAAGCLAQATSGATIPAATNGQGLAIGCGPNGGALPAEYQVVGTASSATSLTWASGNAYLDVSGYSNVSLRWTSAGSGNTFVVEQSDEVTFTNAQVLNMFTINSVTSTFPNQANTVAVATNFVVPVNAKFFRVRISVYGSGTATVAAQLKVMPWVSPIQAVYGSLQPANTTNTTGGQLLTTASLAVCDDTSPPAVTEDRFGPLRMDCATHAQRITGQCDTFAAISVTAGNTTQIVGLSGSTVIRVCNISVTTSLTGSWTLLSGTGSNCGTPANSTGAMPITTATQVTIGDGAAAVWRGTAGGELCVTAVTGNITGWVMYTQL